MSKRRKNKHRQQQDRNVLQFQEPPKQEYNEVASWASDPDYYGFDNELLLNPDWVPGENGYTDVRIYEELLRDGEVRSGLEKRALQVVSESYELQPGSDKARDEKAASSLHYLFGGNFIQAQKEAIEYCLLCGYSVQEALPESVGGVWKLTKWYAKKPWRFHFTPERELRLLTKEAPFYGEPVPTDRPWPVMTWGSSDNPYGRGLGQSMWKPVRLKILLEKLWTLFLDKWAMPSAVFKYRPTGDPAKDKEQQQAGLQAVRHLRNNTGISVTEGDFIELIEAKRTGGSDFEAALEYFNKQIRILIQHQTLTTSNEGIGSDGGFRTHDDVAHTTKQYTALVHATAMVEPVQFLCKWNCAENTTPPVFRWITEKESVQQELANRDKVLVQDIGLKIDPDYFYEKYNIPIPKGGGGFVQKAQQIQPQAVGKQASFASPYSPEQQAIEDHVDELVDSVDLSKNEELILQFVQDYNGDLEDLPEAILEVFPEMDMSSLQFAAEIGSLNGQLHGRRVVQLQKNEVADE
jgi:phage gp29-like protein